MIAGQKHFEMTPGQNKFEMIHRRNQFEMIPDKLTLTHDCRNLPEQLYFYKSPLRALYYVAKCSTSPDDSLFKVKHLELQLLL